MRANHRLWGALARNFVTFSTREDASIEAVTLHGMRPDWVARAGDGRSSAFYPHALQHLYEVGRARGTQLFVNFDDDAMPLWPALLAVLRGAQEELGGRYAYLTSGRVGSLTSMEPHRLLFTGVDASGGELHKARLALADGGVMAPSGFMYALSLSALHDLMAIVETCPIWHPGDGAMGGLLACAGRALDFDLNRERGNYFRPGYMPDSMPAMDVVRAGGATVAGLYGNASNAGGEYPLPAGETRVTVYHKLKSTADMALVYDAFYTPFGWPPAATVLNERNHHSGEERCHYANSTWQWLQDAR